MSKEELLLKFYKLMKKNKFTILTLFFLDYDDEKYTCIYNKNKNEYIYLTDDESKLLRHIRYAKISEYELYNFYHIQEKRKRNNKTTPVTNT